MPRKTTRRGHNEGSIYQRASDGKWVGSVNLGWEGGTRRRKVVYGKTRTEVSQKVTRLLSDQGRGLPIQSAETTVAAFLETWMQEIVIPSRTQGTAKFYQSMINRHLVPALGKHKLTSLSQQHIQTMMNRMQSEGLSPALARQARSVLRAALNQAMRWDLVSRNVAALTSPPKVDRFEGYAVSADQVRAIMAAVEPDDRLRPLYAIATSIGLRKGELLGLCWVDVDLGSALLHVRNQLKIIDGQPALTRLKTASSRRDVPLAPAVVHLLRQHRRREIAVALEHGRQWDEAGYVFAWPDGSPVSISYLDKHWYKVRRRAGLPSNVRFHDLRHGALTMLASRGTSPRSLMGIAGHSQIATTMQIYTHVDAENVRSAVDLMDDLFDREIGAS
jgi:integrase